MGVIQNRILPVSNYNLVMSLYRCVATRTDLRRGSPLLLLLVFIVSSWKYWALIASGLVALCGLILSVLLSYRVRILTATVTAMQLPVRVHSLPI